MLTSTLEPAESSAGRCQGAGIRDGRGYGPFGTGYYFAPGRGCIGDYCPFGPACEKLGPDHDLAPLGGVAGNPFGITGDRPFFMYWQTWAICFSALGVGLLLGIVW